VTVDLVSFFHLLHGRVHSSKVSSVATLADLVFGALTDEQMRVRPGKRLNSLVWLVWHMARVEDVAVNLVVTAGRQVLDDGWSSRLGVVRTDVGHGMTEDDVAEFSAIINPPEGAILAVGSVRRVPVVDDTGLGVGRRMNMTLSCDHRVMDGAMGARFLQDVKRLLEEPLRLLV